MARRKSEPVVVVEQRLAEQEEKIANLERTGSVGTRRGVKRLPYLSDLLRHRPRGKMAVFHVEGGRVCVLNFVLLLVSSGLCQPHELPYRLVAFCRRNR